MCCVFHAFSAVSCLFSNFVSGFKGTSIVSSLSLLVHSGSLPVLKAVSLFTNRSSLNASNPGAGATFSSVNGVPIRTLVKSLVPHFVFLFNFYRLLMLLFCFVLFCFCLPPFCCSWSLLLAVLWCLIFGGICLSVCCLFFYVFAWVCEVFFLYVSTFSLLLSDGFFLVCSLLYIDFILLYFNVSSTLLRKNRNTDFLDFMFYII